MATQPKGCSIAFLAIFSLLWTSVTLLFDGIVVYDLLRQSRSASYPTVQGTVLRSEVKQIVGRKGSSYTLDLAYEYTVGGQRYSSEKYTYFRWSSQPWAQAAAAAHPAKSEVRVYYNPANPADAVLVPGISGLDLFLVLFLTPFNIVMAGSWFAAATLLRPGPIGGVRILENDLEIRARMPRLTPLGGAALMALALSFASIFVVGFSTGLMPSKGLMLGVGGVILALTILVYVRLALILHSGCKDLVLDQLQNQITLPQTFGRKESVILRRTDLTSVDVDDVTQTDNKGNVTHKYTPTIRWREGNKSLEAKLAEWGTEERARLFVDWLREKLQMPIDSGKSINGNAGKTNS